MTREMYRGSPCSSRAPMAVLGGFFKDNREARYLRRRQRMATTEMAPIARIRETDVEDMGNGSNNPSHGVDDGLGGGFDGNPSPGPRNGSGPTPGRGRGGYAPVPTDPAISGKPGRKPVDVNLYATKKTVAQGMMDLALLTANANQLRYVLEAGEYGNKGVYYHVSIVLISLSIIFQVMIGITLIFIGRYNVREEAHAQKADRLNNWVVLGVFLITIVNVFISSFAIEPLEGIDPVMIRALTDKTSVEGL
ncbi:ninjurin-A-like isoform X2 [Penaeus japonicus]|uniref:ninjurin-A-like isoform X2 n=1 Tax=Penaeus japonicus TaxID=27405 RepID=UPI001C7116DC|nr:ninjurin-A-like isoform X2 [Penaeus japonicus]